MSKQAGGRPSKSGARRELKTFRLVPDALDRLERFAGERGVSTSDVLNEFLLASPRLPDLLDAGRPRRLEVLSASNDPDGGVSSAIARFRVLTGGARAIASEESATRVAHELERLRDGLGGVLGEIEGLMAEQLVVPERLGTQGARSANASRPDDEVTEFAGGFRAGMLEALETAYALLQAELLISEGF